MSRKPLKVIAGLAALSLLAAACSSSSTSSSTSTTVKATGTPIVVGQIVPMSGAALALPSIGQGTSASIAALNKRGGINGHPLQLVQCDSKGSADGEVSCAQTLMNSHVVVTLSNFVFASSAQVNQILAGIPQIGITQADPADYSNPANFPINGGGIFSLIGSLDALINKGDKKLTMMINDAPTAGQLHLLIDPIVKAQNAEVVNYVLVSSASGDMSQYVAQAQQNGAQGIASGLANAQEVQFDQAFNQLKPNIDYAAGIGGYSLNQLKQLEPLTTKAIFADWTPGLDDVKNFPGLAQPIADLIGNTKGATINNLTMLPLESWLSAHAFYEVMKSQTGTPTAASILAAVKAAKNIPMNGILKPWTPTNYQSAGAFNSIFGNVSNPCMFAIKYNGTHTTSSLSSLYNTFTGLPGTSSATTSAACK